VNLNTGTVKLTDLASCGGCAAKYSAARLEQLLAGIVPAEAEDLLVGLAPADDAAVYRLDDETALVFTLDFFPPLVDDPREFGTIAATNALNDVFAMGGRPLLALSIAEFPEDLPQETVAAILDAADRQVREAGAILAGGHTIRDDEPKYGLAVVGTVHPDGVWPKSGARPGDALFLTKPLGDVLLLATVRQALERSRAVLLDETEVRALRSSYASLTRRERDVMALVVSGLLNKQVGGELGISEITVKAHRGQVMRKMKAESLPALVMMATRLGMAEARITLRGAVSLVVPFARVLTPSDQQRSSTRGC